MVVAEGAAAETGGGSTLSGDVLSEGAALSALFGGAQYHRLMREFVDAVSSLPAVSIPAEEVINSMGETSREHDPLLRRHRTAALAG